MTNPNASNDDLRRELDELRTFKRRVERDDPYRYSRLLVECKQQLAAARVAVETLDETLSAVRVESDEWMRGCLLQTKRADDNAANAESAERELAQLRQLYGAAVMRLQELGETSVALAGGGAGSKDEGETK